MTPTDIINASENANHLAVLCITGLTIFLPMAIFSMIKENERLTLFSVVISVLIILTWIMTPSAKEAREQYCAKEAITDRNIADYTDLCITFEQSRDITWKFFSNGSLNAGLSDIYDPKNIKITSYNRLYGSFLSNPVEYEHIVAIFSKKLSSVATVPDYHAIYNAKKERDAIREKKDILLLADFNTFMLKHNEAITSITHGENTITYQNLMSLKEDVDKQLKTMTEIENSLRQKCMDNNKYPEECASITKSNAQNKIIAHKIEQAIAPLLTKKIEQSIKNKEMLSR